MPETFPTSVRLQYPLTRTVSSPTRVVEFLDGSEQRWRSGDVLNSFSIQWNGLRAADLAPIRQWFATIKGAYDSTWSFVLGGETFPDMALEDDTLAVVENQAKRLSVSLKFRQTAASGTWSARDARYPAIRQGVITQFPYTGTSSFLTTRNDLETGPRYAYYERATPRRGWKCSYSVIAPAELLTLMQFFVAMGGRFGSFTFTDPDSKTEYTECRFDQDAFEVSYQGRCRCSLTLTIVQIA
jgi:hypothetical protein